METPSPGATLSAVIAEDRRREARRRQGGFGQGGLLPYLVPACGRPAGQRGGRPLHSELMVKLHRWGATFLPKGGGAVARELEEPCRAPSPPPRPRPSFTPAASAAEPEVVPRHEAPAVSVVPTTGPSREREEPAAGSEAIAEADMSAGESAGSSDHQATPVVTVAGGSGGTWLRASPKTRARSPSLQTDSDESPRPLADSAALPVVADDKYVWADKYRPNVLNEFICNKTVAAELYQLVVAHQCRHFIFEGPPAVGKRSMVLALIRDAFGPHDLKIEEQTKRFELKGEIRKHIDVRVKTSEHHVEVSLADLHGYEKYIITTLLSESIPSPSSVCDHTNCRVIVIHDADKLSFDLQHYIGWFLGRYAGCNKIIFCCSDASNLEAIKHLCKVVTLQPPSFDEIINVLEYIATQESIDLPRDLARRITVGANNNLRQTIRSFEATWKANYPFIDGQVILTGWEEEISNVASNIMEEPSPKQLFLVRGKIRKMIEHDVSPHFIFSHLVAELKRDKDEDFQHSVDELASDLNHVSIASICNEPMIVDSKGQCKGNKSREANFKTRYMNIEGFTAEAHDHGETIQCFIKIEEFTVRFLSFYRSLVAKNSNRGSAQ
ncbi:Replication factor C subunit 3 [Zea mays]|uniref:Replication factor C subunit 3 n=1 Tax=Zea mays TaxID=4577 RepID=A0A317YDP8_MAIZE|nr:Replication factor C subunit 3 [Zea mays]